MGFPMLRTPVVMLLLLFSAGQLCGCTEYWWQRGQPRSVGQLVTAANEKLSSAVATGRASRADVVDIAEAIQKQLTTAVNGYKSSNAAQSLRGQMTGLEESFMQLEGKLSIGSRAAYGELSGQLRSLSKAVTAGEAPTFAAFGTFAARTLSFLANELSVPPPVIAS